MTNAIMNDQGQSDSVTFDGFAPGGILGVWYSIQCVDFFGVELAQSGDAGGDNYSVYSLSHLEIENADPQALKNHILMEIIEEKDFVRAESEELSIYACGKTVSLALKEFQQLLAGIWEGLRSTPDEGLTRDAIALKVKLSSHFGNE